MNILENKIKKYTQIYDNLKTLKFDDYINDKRNILHERIYNDSINKLIVDVNSNISNTKIANEIKQSLIKNGINTLDIKNFKFIEYKNKYWYKASKILIIYTFAPIYVNNNRIILKLGPYSLENYWDNSYIISRKIIDKLQNENNIYEIKYIDYITGKCIIKNKINNKEQTIDLDYITENISINEDYDQLFSHIRKINVL